MQAHCQRGRNARGDAHAVAAGSSRSEGHCTGSHRQQGLHAVAEGSPEPFKGGDPHVANFVRGSDGLGNLFLPAPTTEKVEESTVEFLVNKVSQFPGEVSPEYAARNALLLCERAGHHEVQAGTEKINMIKMKKQD